MKLILLRTVTIVTLIILVGCATAPPTTAPPAATSVPPTATSPPPTETPTPTDTPSPTATPPPTDTPTPEPTPTNTPAPTETPTPSPTPTPTVAKQAVKICTVDPEGKPATGSYIAVMNVDYKQIIPDDGSTGIQISSSSGCRSVKLPAGSYHVVGQKVINPFKGIYISGTVDVEVTLGDSVEVKIELTE